MDSVNTKSKFNLNIGAKLGLMSGLGIVLVAAMLGGSIYGQFATKAATDKVNKQQIIAYDFAELKASARGLMVGVRDLRLAETAESIEAAKKYYERRLTSAEKFVDELSPVVGSENRARLEKIKLLLAHYTAGQKEIADIMSELAALLAKRSDASADDTAAKVAALKEKSARIAVEKTLPAIAEVQDLVDHGADLAKSNAQKEVMHAAEEMAFAEYLSLGIGSSVILVLIGSAIFGALSIARPLARVVPELEKLADGNFNVTLPGLGRGDEVGQIARAAELVAERVGMTIGQIKIAASEVTNASAEISTSTTDLSQRTEEQAASLEQTSASMEEMTATVRKNAENAREASSLASNTQTVADQGGQVVAQTVSAMAEIEQSSRKISDIIGVIDEIARQTNLLALNAAVEAARAGDAGRGFAVVASEVRSLAQRSSQAAKDIKDLITNSNDQVKNGVDLVNKAGASLHQIVESIQKVTVVVSEIANASAEQSTGIEEINKALTQMDEVTQQNSALVEENAATAKTLEHQAKAMDDRVAGFRLRNNGEASTKPANPAPYTAKPVAAKAPATKRPEAKPAANPVAEMRTGLATALKAEPDWAEF